MLNKNTGVFYFKSIISLSLVFASSFSFASPVVLFDSGKTISASDYYPFDYPDTSQLNANYPAQTMKMFPIRTSKLSVGRVAPRMSPITIYMPICIVGSDITSKQYLKSSAKKLKQLNTTCYVVNVKSEQEFNQLQKIVPDITLVPANGDEFVKLLNLKHYPVLITSKGIE